jgi:D-arabinose 5-phosphate isomerase GutQ
MKKHFKRQIKALHSAYDSLDTKKSKLLLETCLRAIRNGNSIIASGLGKNVPICEKFIGTLNSLGIKAHFLHTNSAIHGDLGIIRDGDVVIVLSKSGETHESIYLCKFLKQRTPHNWVLTCKESSTLEQMMPYSIFLDIKHEGDHWDIIPNNSSLTFLVYLQSLAMAIIEDLPVKLETFHDNHPGGAIGRTLGVKLGKRKKV